MLLLCGVSYSQITTSTISGVIYVDGEPAKEIKLIMRHLPTNYETEAETNNKGNFTIDDLEVGGPYELTIMIHDVKYYRRYNYLILGENEIGKIEISTN